MTAPNQTKEQRRAAYAEKLAATADEWRRADALVDEARLEEQRASNFTKQAEDVAAATFMRFRDLAVKGEIAVDDEVKEL